MKNPRNLIRRFATNTGIGLVAGAAGTAAMTAVQVLEMKFSDRGSSSAPAEAVERLVDVRPKDEEASERLSNAVHWMYGTALGAGRGVLGAIGLPSKAADPLFFSGVWGAPMAFLPALEISPPITEWSNKQRAMDAMHHLVYATAVALVYRALTNRRPAARLGRASIHLDA